MIYAAHDWFHPIWDHGPYKGNPAKRRQCRRCKVWETKWNKRTQCPLTPVTT